MISPNTHHQHQQTRTIGSGEEQLPEARKLLQQNTESLPDTQFDDLAERKRENTIAVNDERCRARAEQFAQSLHKCCPARVRDILDRTEQSLSLYAQVISRMARHGGYIVGPLGTGKTVLLWRVLFARAKYQNCVYSAPELAEAIRDINQYSAVIERLKQAAFLAIDDLGAEKITEHYQTSLFSIINYRYDHQLPILASGNYPLFLSEDKSIADIYGERLADRLAEMWPMSRQLALTKRLRCD